MNSFQITSIGLENVDKIRRAAKEPLLTEFDGYWELENEAVHCRPTRVRNNDIKSTKMKLPEWEVELIKPFGRLHFAYYLHQ